MRGRGRLVLQCAAAIALITAMQTPGQAQQAPDPEPVPAPVATEPERRPFTFDWYWDKGIRYDIEVPFDKYWVLPDEGPLERPFEERLALIGRIGGRLPWTPPGGSSRTAPRPVDAVQVRHRCDSVRAATSSPPRELRIRRRHRHPRRAWRALSLSGPRAYIRGFKISYARLLLASVTSARV